MANFDEVCSSRSCDLDPCLIYGGTIPSLTQWITPLHVTYASGRKLMYLAFQQFIILVFSFGMIGGLIVLNGSLFQDMCGASESLSPFAWFGIYLVVIHMGTGLVRKLFKLAKCKWRRRGGLA